MAERARQLIGGAFDTRVRISLVSMAMMGAGAGSLFEIGNMSGLALSIVGLAAFKLRHLI